MKRRGLLKVLGLGAAGTAVGIKALDKAPPPAKVKLPQRGQVEVVSSRSMRIPIELRPGGNFGHFNPEGGSLGRGSGPVYETLVVNRQEYEEVKNKSSWTERELYEYRLRQSRRS